MFSKLKEKLKSWTKKVTEETEEIPTEIVETPKKQIKKKNTTPKKKENKEKTIKEETKLIHEEELKPDKPGFFKKAFSNIHKVTISEKEFEIYEEELQILLLENNVAFEVAEKIVQDLKIKIIGKEINKKEIEIKIKNTLKEIIKDILIEPFEIKGKIKGKKSKGEPYVILFCGINGTGKTTTIAKIANSLKKQNISCVLAAGDTFRAASIEQITHHGDKLGIKVISQDYGTDPASVGFDAIKYAKKNAIDCVLIDTAGRMHTSKNLLNEIEKISRVTKPDLKLFIGESITGNDVIEQLKSFDNSIGIDGIVLTKADIDDKGGTALSVGYATKKPILYLGTGQEYHEIEQFDKDKFIERLGL